MLLRIIAKIGKEAATKMLAVNTQIEEITEIMNFQYFREELEARASKNIKNFEASTKKDKLIIFEEEIGSFETPEHFISVYFGENEYLYNRNKNKPNQKYLLTLQATKEYNASKKISLINFALSVKKENSRNNFTEYQLGDFSEQNDEIDVINFINYFACQEEMYKKIFQLLKTKKEIITKYLGLAVAEDLIQLFSCKKREEEPLNLVNEKLEKILYLNEESYPEKIEAALVLLSVVRSNGDEKRRSDLTFAKLNLSLKKANKLILDYYFYEEALSLASKLITDKDLEKIKENKPSKNFLEKNLNKWVNALINYASFGTNVFDKIKTKFLVKAL